jgi:hypothetical protein
MNPPNKNQMPPMEQNGTNIPASERIIEVEAIPVGEAKKSPSEIAGERRENIGNYIADKKDRLVSTVKNTGQKIGNFFGKVKAFGGKAVEGAKNLAGRGVETALNVAIAPDAYYKAGKEAVGNFVKDKAERIANFVEGKASLLEMKANFVASKTLEKYDEIKTKVTDRYEGLKQFGVDSIEAGQSKIRSIKEGVNEKKNSFIISILEKIRQKHQDKADKVARTIAGLQTI